MNLWSTWTVKDLQELIDSEESGLLNRLETVLPGILGDGFAPHDLYSKFRLREVIEAFLPSESFASKTFRNNCLNRISPTDLKKAAIHLELDSRGDFEQTRNTIVAQPWQEPFARKFLEFFQLPFHFLPGEKIKKDDCIDLRFSEGEPPKNILSNFMQLIDYQFGVYNEALKKLGSPRARFVIQMPTGSGKTRTAMEIVSRVLNSSDRISVFWLAHTGELCEQGIQCFLHVWPHLAEKSVIAHRCWGDHSIPIPRSNANDFIVGGFDKLNAALRRNPECLDQFQSRCRLIVIDEAHKTEAPTYKNVVKSLMGANTSVIGLTATPGRTYEEETESLSNFYFNELIELPDPNGVGVIELLRDRRVLSKAKYIPILTDINIPLTERDKKHLEKNFDLPPRIINQLAQNDIRNIEIIQTLRKEIRSGKRVLVFGCSVGHSKFLNSILLYLKATGENIETGHIDGSTSLVRREELITRFKEGELDVLCNYGVLSTGFDAPKTDAVMITRPTASPVLYSQMVGRGLRGPVIGGTEFCSIIDVRDNIEGFGDADSVYSRFDDYWVSDN